MDDNMIDLIRKKREGKELTKDEICRLVQGVVDGSLSDVQMGALLMAVFLCGASDAETRALTSSYRTSGRQLSWSASWSHVVVDKHSTGGVGDKVSLVLAPALAACGARVPMVSGRGLQWTGGTLDKMEAVPGFDVDLDAADVERVVAEVGCCIVGQSHDLVPADRRLYAARHLTSTVDHPALITASIISKKAAENVCRLVMDVKCGRGALSRSVAEAETLARRLVKASAEQGISTSAAITPMDSPLGRAVGNALEVAEAVAMMRQKPNDNDQPTLLFQLVTQLGGELLSGVGLASDREDGANQIALSLHDGSALDVFYRMLQAQGVNSKHADELCHGDPWKVLQRSAYTTELRTSHAGYVGGIDALVVGQSALAMGAGRIDALDVVDPSVGVELLVDVGTRVKMGETWLRVHHATEILSPSLKASLADALDVVAAPPPPQLPILLWVS